MSNSYLKLANDLQFLIDEDITFGNKSLLSFLCRYHYFHMLTLAIIITVLKWNWHHPSHDS